MDRRWFAAVLLTLLLAASPSWGSFTTADDVYYWFACRQSPEGPVLSEKEDSFTVEEQTLSALVFLNRGHYHRAKKILSFLDDIRVRDPGFDGFYGAYSEEGDPRDSAIRTRDQLWAIIGIVWYTQFTGDRGFLPLAGVLAQSVLKREGPEGGFMCQSADGDIPADTYTADHLLACSAFWGLGSAVKSAEYRSAALRSYQYLNRSLRSDASGDYVAGGRDRHIVSDDVLSACLLFGKQFGGGKKFPEPDDALSAAKLALVYFQNGESERSGKSLSVAEKYALRSRRYPGAAALVLRTGAAAPDIAASAWFIFANELFNPFIQDADIARDTEEYAKTVKVFSGDDFSGGALSLMRTYRFIEEGEGTIGRSFMERSNSGYTPVLRLHLAAKTSSAPLRRVIARRFLWPQDFSTVRAVQFQVKAVPGTGTFDPLVAMKFGFVDGDGELWISNDIELHRRNMPSYAIPFPLGWKCVSGKKGNTVFNIDQISELQFIVTQYGDNPWEISLGNVSVQ